MPLPRGGITIISLCSKCKRNIFFQIAFSRKLAFLYPSLDIGILNFSKERLIVVYPSHALNLHLLPLSLSFIAMHLFIIVISTVTISHKLLLCLVLSEIYCKQKYFTGVSLALFIYTL